MSSESEHDAPEWQLGPAAGRIMGFHNCAAVSKERFLVKFEATDHTYAMWGKAVEGTLKKVNLRQLPVQPSSKRAPVPTEHPQQRPVTSVKLILLLSLEVGRRGRVKLKSSAARRPSISR